MKEIQAIQDLINSLKIIPGIGNKSAERIAYDLLKLPEEKINSLITSLSQLKEKIKICPICGAYKEGDTCSFCSSDDDSKILIVVSTFKDLLAVLKLNLNDAAFHVLNGSISPIKGITADDINITSLLKRVQNNNYEEIILATNPDIDGETTALYINRLLEKFENIKVSRLGYGLPMGANIDYADELTLTRSFEGRTHYKKR